MDIPVDVIAKKAVWAIIILSVLLMVCGAVFFHSITAFESYETLPFAVGVVFSMMLNIAKVFMLKRTVKRVADINSVQSGKRLFYLHHFSQLGLTVIVLLIAALAPDNVVNIIGAIIGLFTFKLTMHIMQIYVPNDETSPSEMPLADFTQETTLKADVVDAKEGD